MSEEKQDTNESIDWTNPDAVAAKLLGEGAEPVAAEVEAVAETTAETGEEVVEGLSSEADKPRNDKGQFMPLQAHKDVLERERSKREAIEEELAALKAKQDAGPAHTDEQFEAYLRDLPDDVADTLRAERTARIKAEEKSAQLAEEREATAKAAEAAQNQALHEKCLAKTPKLAAAYEDEDEQAKIDRIADRVRKSNPKYGNKPTVEFYQAVEAEYLRKATPMTRPLPGRNPNAAPTSLSALPGVSPQVSTPLESFASATPMQNAARLATMPEADLQKYLATLR